MRACWPHLSTDRTSCNLGPLPRPPGPPGASEMMFATDCEYLPVYFVQQQDIDSWASTDCNIWKIRELETSTWLMAFAYGWPFRAGQISFWITISIATHQALCENVIWNQPKATKAWWIIFNTRRTYPVQSNGIRPWHLKDIVFRGKVNQGA